MHTIRLERLLTILERVRDTPLPFSMKGWFSDPTATLDPTTAACAFGWMARDEQAQREGLDIIHTYERASVTFRQQKGAPAAALYFDLTLFTAGGLFYGTRYRQGRQQSPPDTVSPNDVIAKVSLVLANNGEIPIKRTGPENAKKYYSTHQRPTKPAIGEFRANLSLPLVRRKVHGLQ